MPNVQHFPATADPAAIMAALRRDGAIIIDGLIPDPEMAALAAEIAPWLEATPNGRDDFTGHLTTRTGALVARSPRVRDLVMHPLIHALCDDLLKPYCERWQLHLTQAIRIRPGQKAQAIHRDRWAWGTHLAHVEPQLNTIWAVTDFTAENGATQLVPGSLDWSDSRVTEPHEIVPAVMKRGSVLVYTGGVFHGGGENRSTLDRIGLNLTYTLGWLRQEENQYLSCPPAIARTLDPALQAVLGYAMGSYALGYFTPPLPPGQGPEVVSPQWVLGQGDGLSGFSDSALLASITAQVRS
ncbi:phytanoyl-CoA dioxygenase [Sphingomonas sp. IBVSS1]|nr:phytanoyl-CoA dioxygenase [Sphingomonas sp. IBVSS1]